MGQVRRNIHDLPEDHTALRKLATTRFEVGNDEIVFGSGGRELKITEFEGQHKVEEFMRYARDHEITTQRVKLRQNNGDMKMFAVGVSVDFENYASPTGEMIYMVITEKDDDEFMRRSIDMWENRNADAIEYMLRMKGFDVRVTEDNELDVDI